MSEEFEFRAPEQSEEGLPKEEKSGLVKELFEWMQIVVFCVVTAVLIFNCVARISRVDGQSMDHTLKHNEMLLVWSLGYEPKQGDIIILNKTTADFLGEHAIVKRVIATGGQTVDIDYDTSTVYVDGEALEEPYILEDMEYPWYSHMGETHFEIPEGQVFVMGDNRNNSTDSRDDRLGFIDEDYILGKAVFALFPLNRVGVI